MSDKVTAEDNALRKKHGITVQPDPIKTNDDYYPGAHDLAMGLIEETVSTHFTAQRVAREADAAPEHAFEMLCVAFKILCNERNLDPKEIIQQRRNFGLEKYGTILRPYNGRDNVADAMDEMVDGIVYLICEIIERDERERA